MRAAFDVLDEGVLMLDLQHRVMMVNEAFARLGIPALIVQGSRDFQVDVDEALLLQKAKPEAQLLLIDGMNHVLRIVPAAAPPLASYNDPRLPLPNELLDGVARFVLSSAP